VSSSRLTAALADRYGIERELGAGGMATVYLAEDLKHKRRVALKVLKPELAAVLGADRFVQEITTTAALQHPHILPLFDSGEADGFLYYVMPFIQGETLREKLTRDRQLGVDEAVRIATEVADALEYAHSNGVIHRDIKPENILLANGRPMVADFGIALAVSAAAGGRMTETGLSLGTPHYMSPEQATADREITGRSDTYSLASVLYEMLAGVPPHEGGTAQQTIMRIIADTPRPVTDHRKSVPANVAAAVAKALEKLPADRFDSAKAFANALGNPGFGHLGARRSAAGGASYGVPAGAFAATAMVAFAATGGFIWAMQGRAPAPPDAPTVRVPVDLPTGYRIAPTAAAVLAISPQGDLLAYVVQGPANVRTMIRRTDDLAIREVVGGVGGTLVSPAFSPDGKWLALSEGSQLSKIAVDGGTAIPLGAVQGATRGLAWFGQDTILIGTDRGLYAIPSRGGTPDRVAGTDSTINAVQPAVLPGGTVAFTTGAVAATRRIAVTSLKTTRTTILETRAAIVVGMLEGHLLYVTATGDLSAVPFDEDEQRVTGNPVQLEDDIRLTSAGMGQVALSASGSLWYVTGQSTGHLVRLNARTREETRMLDEQRAFRYPRFAPDGKRVAVSVTVSAGSDIWLYDLANRTFAPLTTDQNDNWAPEWTSNGSRVVFRSARGGRQGVWWQPSDVSSTAELLYQPEHEINEVILSPDDKWLIYRTPPGVPNRDIFSVPLDGDRKATLLVGGPSQESHARVSPNGKWLVYQSDERGRFEVYVRPFPGSGARVPISNAGGSEPIWSRNGRRIYYRTPSGGLESAALTDGAALTVASRRTELATSDYLNDPTHPSWDLWPDESAFLMVKLVGGEVRPILVHNWARAVRERLAVGKR
jgi:eukaryotic-like serine/threonine-protein kinase